MITTGAIDGKFVVGHLNKLVSDSLRKRTRGVEHPPAQKTPLNHFYEQWFPGSHQTNLTEPIFQGSASLFSVVAHKIERNSKSTLRHPLERKLLNLFLVIQEDLADIWVW
eukprot:c3898_g1_i2.p1 GENE.c3898_g1_i2~~c3898_g1_i2.p1  ORF type:complete len:110 (-),score=20.53 c3898_g1_i2:58-387(-)